MSRSVCTFFVALAIFQGAFVEPSVDVFDGERANFGFVGDLTIGKGTPSDATQLITAHYTNNQNVVVEKEVRLTPPGESTIIHYVRALNENNSTAVVCSASKILGSTEALLKIRLPAMSKSTILYTIAWH